MTKSELKQKLKRYFEFIYKYPKAIDFFNQIRNLRDFYQNGLQMIQVAEPVAITDDTLLEYLNESIDLLELIEKEIVNNEKKINYQYPTYNFEAKKIIAKLHKIKSKSKQINYLQYILKEYPDYLIRRENKLIELSNEKISKDENFIRKIFSIVYYISQQDNGRFQYFEIELPPRRFEEIIIDELQFVINKYEETGINWEGKQIDLLHFSKSLAESGTIEVKRGRDYLQMIYYYFGIKEIEEEDYKVIEDVMYFKTKNQESKNTEQNIYYTVKDIMEMFKVSRTTLDNW